MTCSVSVGDYFGMFVPNTSITFLTEAGGVPATVQISEQGGDPNQAGVASFTYRTECPSPKDVAPDDAALPGETGTSCNFWNQCKATPGFEPRTCNPRDGWATLVAITVGQEKFTDKNANLTWDPGEQWDDLPEPYVDANDNGMYDVGEDYYPYNDGRNDYRDQYDI